MSSPGSTLETHYRDGFHVILSTTVHLFHLLGMATEYIVLWNILYMGTVL